MVEWWQNKKEVVSIVSITSFFCASDTGKTLVAVLHLAGVLLAVSVHLVRETPDRQHLSWNRRNFGINFLLLLHHKIPFQTKKSPAVSMIQQRMTTMKEYKPNLTVLGITILEDGSSKFPTFSFAVPRPFLPVAPDGDKIYTESIREESS